MAGFRYLAQQPSGAPKFRQYLSLAGSKRKSKGVIVNVVAGFTGTVAVTGIGFEPEALLILGGELLLGDENDEGLHHLGFAAGPAGAPDQWGGGVYYGYLGDLRQARWSDSEILAASGGGITGTVDSFDADGFTLDITTGPPWDSDLACLAIRGEGNYHVGTATSPTTVGTQAITGLGFEPTAIFFSSAQRYDDAAPGDGLSNKQGEARICHGIGGLEGQWNVWAGSNMGDVYTNQAAQDGAVLSLWQDANAIGPFQPAILAEATLDSFDADGFTLDWTAVDPVNEFYFSWFAVDDYTQVGRWTYQHFSNAEVARILTRRRPKALIFPSNAMAINGSQNEANSGGATLGLGFCDQRGARGGAQYGTSFQDLNAPAFSVPRAMRDMRAWAFGAFNRHSGGQTLTNTQDDAGLVTPFGRDHLLRLHVGQ